MVLKVRARVEWKISAHISHQLRPPNPTTYTLSSQASWSTTVF